MPTLHLTCKRCTSTKNRTEFKRLASLAQSRAWLKNPNASKRIWYYGDICNACHKQTKRKPSELTPEELRKHLINEGNDAEYAEWAANQHRLKGKQRMAENMKEVLRKRRADGFEPLLATVNKLHKSLKAKVDYARRTRTPLKDKPNAEVMASDIALTVYLDSLVAYLAYARIELRLRQSSARQAPARWQDLISQEAKDQIQLRFNSLSAQHRDKLNSINKQFL